MVPSPLLPPERYSKLRPLTGTRARQTPGPSWTLAPLPKNSSPMAVPHWYIRSLSKEAVGGRGEKN